MADGAQKRRLDKLFPDWLSIAFGVDSLDDIAAANAEIDRDEKQDYLKDRDYKAEVERLKGEFPNLLGFAPAFHRQIMWIFDHASGLTDWHEKLSADRRAKLSHPGIIRRGYEADVGGQS